MAVGGVALFLASLIAATRMAGDWADLPIWLLLVIPCVLLLGLAARPDGLSGSSGVEPWRVAFGLAGLVLLGFALVQTTIVLGDDAPGNVTATWVLIAVGVLAILLARRTNSRGATLLACVALGGALFAFADWTGDGLGVNGVRDLFLAEGVAFLIAAAIMRRTRIEHSHLLVAIGAAALIVGALLGAFDEIEPSILVLPEGFADPPEVGGVGWELILLGVSLGSLAYAALEAARGPAYVGILGLLAFFSLVLDGSLMGWPLVLAGIAAVAIAYGLTRPRAGEPVPHR